MAAAVPKWLIGLGFGLLAAAVGWFVAAPLKGLPVASWLGGWTPCCVRF